MKNKRRVGNAKPEKPRQFHHYSGPNSEGFWKRVNALPESRHGELYFAGVLLQNMEESILRMLSLAENEAREDKRAEKS